VFSWILQELWVGCEGVFLLRISGRQSQVMMELVLGIKTFLIYFNNSPLPPLIPVSAPFTGCVMVFVFEEISLMVFSINEGSFNF